MDETTIRERRPGWIKVRRLGAKAREMMARPLAGLNTVCVEANCPNIGECWARGTATFMIMGATCTRACGFCDVAFGKPEALNPHEPELLAASIAGLGLEYSVITCVDRDDLEDSGAAHWVACIEAVRRKNPGVKVEILTGDFKGAEHHVATVARARPEVFAHNVETVPRLQKVARHKATWERSCRVLDVARDAARAAGFTMFIKTGMMLGLGETDEEVRDAMRILLSEHNVELLTLGQYLMPRRLPDKLAVDRYVEPQRFEEFKQYGLSIGYKGVAASPLTRSSHLAETLYADAVSVSRKP
ncbi:lipoyl synthase [bacterium]|nr:lipoyl synthase [bacterium]